MCEIMRDDDQLYEQAEIFKLFIQSREHYKDVNADDTPQISRVGSLGDQLLHITCGRLQRKKQAFLRYGIQF